jgi:hypothetical protein
MPVILFFVIILNACALPSAEQEPQQPGSRTVTAARPSRVGDIALPKGYKRITAPENSYGAYLRNIKLKRDHTVYLYDGSSKRNQAAQHAVLDLDIGTRDLQQCADAVMRLRAEYLYAQKKYSAISFRFTNGFNCDYARYAAGYRLQVSNNQCKWIKKGAENYSYSTFRQYLDLVFSYAGTKSLYHQLESAPLSAIKPGAVFIQTGEPYGHAVTVMDVAYNPSTNDTIFLLSQSYMPAQSIHLLRNPEDEHLSPWYSVRFGQELVTPEWTFTAGDLRQF